MKSWYKVMRWISWLGQIGFTLVTPPLVMIFLALWLQKRFSLRSWIVIVAMIIGLLTSVTSAYSFYRSVMADQKRRSEKEDQTMRNITSFHHHE